MSGINSDQQIDLLFKEFNVVANTEQAPTSFANQPFLFRDNILNQQILAQEVPSTLPSGFSISELDICGNIAIDSSLNLSVIGYPQLTFYKKLELQQAGNNSAWWYIDGAGKNLLQDTIPFKFDESSADSYNSQLFYELSPGSYSAIARDQAGTKYLMDTKTGIIEFYENPVTLNTIINASSPPRLSFIAYTGTKGITGGGGGGGDASFNIIDVSFITLDGNNLMQKFSAEPWDSQAIGPSFQKEYIISEIPVSTANTMGYFTLQLGPPEYHNINFIAGIHPSGSTGVIKILSNINTTKYGFNRIRIITDPSNTIFYLTINIDLTGGGSPTFDYLNITLVNNNENMSTSLKDWNLKPMIDLPSGPIYTPIADISINLIEPVYGMTTQPEYFQNDLILGPNSKIIPDSGNFTPIISGLGTVDICGGLYVSNKTYLNQDTGIRGQLDVCANIVGGNDIIGLSGEIIGQGNSVFVNYKYFDDSDFTTTSTVGNPNTLAPNWCIIAELDGNGLVNNSCIFQIIDRSDGVDVNLTFILGVNEGSSPTCSLNVLENNYSNNYSGNGFFIRNVSVVRVQTGASFTTQKFYLQLDRVAYANSSPTRLDVRTYLNTQNVQSGSDPVYPWILGSYGNTLPSGTTIYPLEVNLQQQTANANNKFNVVTNAYSVNLNGGFFGYNVDMSNNDITNINKLTGNSKIIDFNSSNELDITSDNSINLIATNNVVVNIDSGNNYTFSNTSLNFDGKNIINVKDISGVNGQPLNIDGSNINLTAESDILIKTNTEGNRIILDSGVTTTTNPNYDQIIYQNEELEMGANTLSVRTVKASKELFTNNTLIDFDISGTNFYLKPGTFDVNQHDISNVDTLTVDKIYQNSPSNQIILGNFINGTDKYIKMGNKIALHTTTSLSNAINENNTSNPNNYLTGYNDSDICGGLIYNIGRLGPNDFSMNKLITTTSSMRFSTNFFRTLSTGNSYSRQQNILYTAGNPEPFYGVGFNYTDQLITDPGMSGWYPGSPTYTTPTYNPGTTFNMKNLQLSRNQLIRVLNFTFEGWNTSYQFNSNLLGAPNDKLYYEIVFGFGISRVLETGPWSTEGQKIFQRCYQVDTSNTMIVNGVSAINSISRVDLSLNTVWNQNDPNSIYQKVPIENKTIPTAVDTGTTLYNDLAPYIFIRAMNGDTGQPWTLSSSSVGSPSWTLINNTNTSASPNEPVSDLPWTAPFGAQFQFEHFIPADDNLPP